MCACNQLKMCCHGNRTTTCDMFLFVFVMICTLSMVASQPSWITKPQDSSVLLDGRLTLSCRIADRGQKQIAWLRSNAILFLDSLRFNAPENFDIEQHTDGYDLVIKNAVRADDTDYQCQLQQSSLNEVVSVVVQVPPEIPVITLNKTDLYEGDFLALTCSSSGGNPAPTIRWLKNGVSITGATLTPPSAKFGTTSSVLLRELQVNDHGSEYTCEVENVANQGQAVTKSIVLQVKYAPVITFGRYNPLKVIEDTPVTLTCSADANPLPSLVQWEKNGSPVGERGVVSFASVYRDDRGEYVCKAQNTIGQKEATLSFDVHYAPSVSIRVPNLPVNDQVLKVNELVKVNLSCIVDSNPPPSESIEWLHNGGTIIYQGPHFVSESISRTQSGNYTCRARNVLTPSAGTSLVKQGQAMLQVIVQYRPGRANITGPSYAIKGELATLHCTVSDPGVPAAVLTWTRVGSMQVLHRGADLIFNPATLGHNDEYICRPANDVGDGDPTTFKFVVNERPEWLSTPPAEQTVNISWQGLSAQCRVRGRPMPQVRWYKDGELIGDHDGLFSINTLQNPIDTYSFNVTSTLLWQGSNRDSNKLRIEDAGTYSCRTSNDISTQDLKADMKLIIQYPPVMNATADKVAIDINQSAVLVCHAHSVPSATFSWYNRSMLLTSGGRVHITNVETPGVFPSVTMLNISEVRLEDLGNYTCLGRNQMGTSRVNIHLTVKTVPDSPKGLHILEKTWESVDLQWEAGFDGGYSQWFYITYVSPTFGTQRVTVDPPQATRFNVTELYPGTNYTFKVFGENLLGGGEYSKNISTYTYYFEIEPPTEVYYHMETRTLNFKSPSTNYCVHVETFDGMEWNLYEECAHAAGGSMKINEGVVVEEVQVALCLQRRKDICSAQKKAMPVDQPQEEDLPASTIVIVASICGTIVVILLIILIVLCVRRHQAKQKEQYGNGPQMEPANNGNMKNGNKGFDNPTMDAREMQDMEDPSAGGVFTTNSSQLGPNGNYVAFDRRKPGPNGYIANGYPANGWNKTNGSTPNDPPPDYDSVDGKPKPFTDPIDPVERLKDNSDSGVSTPDPSKPKKVIYEVIV